MISWVIRIMLRLTAASSMIMDLSFIIKHPGRDLKGARPVPFNPMNLFFCFIAHFIEQNIGNNAQNQSTGNRSERDLSNRECHTADSGNQNDRRSKQIPVIIEINRLQHLQAGYSDETVQSDTDTTHDTAWNRGQERGERTNERNQNGQNRCRLLSGW